MNFAEEEESTRVQVGARFRPPNRIEKAYNGEENCCEFGLYSKTVSINNKERNASFNFSFDHIFGPDTTQNACYRQVAAPLVDTVLSGINAAVIAYGQTGSGKTHTMFGPGFDLEHHIKGARWNCPVQEFGIIPRMFEDIFARASMQKDRYQCDLECAFVQLYNEKCTDLITTLQLKVRQNAAGSFESNALFTPIDSTEELLVLVREGLSNRVTAKTNANVESSRSHAILTTKIIMKDLLTSELKISTLHLVDLAGSEKVSKTGADGTRLIEASSINRSLHALSLVIEALSKEDKKVGKKGKGGKRGAFNPFIPYRDSVLTKLLKNTLGGNSKTVLLLCGSSHEYNINETISTLEFGSRAKNIKNRPIQNVELTADHLRDAIFLSMNTITKQNISIRKVTRSVLLHRRLVQQVLSRIPTDASILKDIYRSLPLLASLPQVWKWGDRFIPIFLLQFVFVYCGLDGCINSMVVSKEWLKLLTKSDRWDINVWKISLESEQKRVGVYKKKDTSQSGTATADNNVQNKESEDITSDDEGSSVEKLPDGYWRKKAILWVTKIEKERLDAIRRRFREKEINKIGRESNLVLLK